MSTDPNSCTFPMICHASTHKHTQKGALFNATQLTGVHANGVGVRVLTRFRRRNLRPPLPAIVLTNARSLKNKTDELFQLMSFKREIKDASVLCITETWLDPLTPDTAVTAPGHILFSADRCPVLSQKEKGGGVCFLVNHRWCNDGKLVS